MINWGDVWSFFEHVSYFLHTPHNHGQIITRADFHFAAENWNPKEHSLIEEFRVAIVLAEAGAYEPATQLAGVQITLLNSYPVSRILMVDS